MVEKYSKLQSCMRQNELEKALGFKEMASLLLQSN
tara:strand:+ start:21583 stop:21687 length:105 start_codon:yes stop_codon:yes gene_type:complete